MNKLDRLNAVARTTNHPNLRPRDAASLIIYDTSGGLARVLIGRRHPRQLFLPNKYVFPGGRVEPGDQRLNIASKLSDSDVERLLIDMKGRASPSRARGLALAAVRETFEETGIAIGRQNQESISTRAKAWQSYLATGICPKLEAMTFIARAITPPGRPRRFDTRFFAVSAEEIGMQTGNGDGEFTELHWLTLEEARQFDLHAMTRTILDDFAERLDAEQRPKQDAPVPYYYTRNGLFVRDRIPDESDS